MIEIQELSKRYRGQTVVDRLSFRAKPGTVTGFLGPNGSGKTTTLRMALGLARPDGGHARINGRRYCDLSYPLRHVGAVLDAGAVHSGRTARAHLRALAFANGIAPSRVRDVLGEVGLESVRGDRAGTFSLGMRQRLGIAAALLGDPEVLILDEPINGLDPDGVRWIRELLKTLAGEGRTVLLSSHLMSEMELTAERIVVIGRGRLIADTSVAELAGRYSSGVRVRSPRPEALAAALGEGGAEVAVEPDGAMTVTEMSIEDIAATAAAHGHVLHEVAQRETSLEEAYMQLTASTAEYRGGVRDEH